MGMRLGHCSLLGDGIVSEANPPGALQLTLDGLPLTLLNDRGTIGGYSKPAIVRPEDIPRLVQVRDGQRTLFCASGEG